MAGGEAGGEGEQEGRFAEGGGGFEQGKGADGNETGPKPGEGRRVELGEGDEGVGGIDVLEGIVEQRWEEWVIAGVDVGREFSRGHDGDPFL
jgi:hypothetical protein